MSYVASDVEGGCQYLYEVRAVNKMGKSPWSSNFIVQVPAEVDPNAVCDVTAELRKGHLWLECWDGKVRKLRGAKRRDEEGVIFRSL